MTLFHLTLQEAIQRNMDTIKKEKQKEDIVLGVV